MARRRIEPPEGMDPAVARFIEALARAAARYDLADEMRTQETRNQRTTDS